MPIVNMHLIALDAIASSAENPAGYRGILPLIMHMAPENATFLRDRYIAAVYILMQVGAVVERGG